MALFPVLLKLVQGQENSLLSGFELMFDETLILIENLTISLESCISGFSSSEPTSPHFFLGPEMANILDFPAGYYTLREEKSLPPEFGGFSQEKKEMLLSSVTEDSFSVDDDNEVLPKEALKMENNLSCRFCDKLLSSQSQLRRHENIHTDLKAHSCHLCPYKTNRKDKLNLHLRSRHDSTTGRSHRCSKCSKSFTSPADLKNHLAVHETLRRNICGLCGKAYKTEKSVKQHIKESHHQKGVKKFLCGKCGRGFKQMSGLNFHNKTKH